MKPEPIVLIRSTTAQRGGNDPGTGTLIIQGPETRLSAFPLFRVPSNPITQELPR